LTGQRRGWLLTGASWLVELYRDWDKPAEAARWRAEQDDLRWAIADAPPAVK
jgi:hypothetical protein